MKRRRANRANIILFVLLFLLFAWLFTRPGPIRIGPIEIGGPSGTPVVVLPTGLPAPAPGGGGATAPAAPAPTPGPAADANRNLALGNPSGATHDPAQPTNYLIERPQYALSYNRDRGTPNWVSWQLRASDLGNVGRSPTFVPDAELPAGWHRVTLDDYTGSGYDRGHMCPSGDRTATVKDNEATFILTNVVPQAPDNNRGTWEHLESYSRALVNKGHTLYIIAGGDGTNGTIAKGKVAVPQYTWKIVVVLPKGASGIDGITAETPVIAVRIPNGLGEKLGDWDQYRVTVDAIEAATGFHFFSNLAPDLQKALKSRIDPAPAS
jgi:endonuclease G